MYVALARTVLTDVDRDKIADEVRNFRSRYPEYSRDDLVNRLIHHTAVRCGVIGAVASAPPGFLAVLPLLWAALRRGQRDTATVALILSAFAGVGFAAHAVHGDGQRFVRLPADRAE